MMEKKRVIFLISMLVLTIIILIGLSLIKEKPQLSPSEELTFGSLVTYYKFDNNLDDSFGENDGDGDLEFVEGKIKNAVDFDEKGGYADVGDKNSLNFGNKSFSISFWAKGENVDGNIKFLFNKNHRGLDHGYFCGIHNNIVKCSVEDGKDFTDVNMEAGEISNKEFNHYVFVVDKENNVAQTYKNGFFQNKIIIEKLGDTTNPEPFIIGDSKGEINASLDELRIYKKALNDQEINELYKESSLVTYYKFDNNLDDSFGENDGDEEGDLEFVEDSKKGKVLDLEKGYVLLPNLNLTNGKKSFSLSMWFKTKDEEKRYIYSSGSGNEKYFGLYTENKNLRFDFNNGEETRELKPANISTNQWHHVILSYERSKFKLYDSVSYYVDGEYIDSFYLTNEENIENNEQDRIGYKNSSSEKFNGKIDEVKFYDVKLNLEDSRKIIKSSFKGGCNNNGVCESKFGENIDNCPVDCKPVFTFWPIQLHMLNSSSRRNYEGEFAKKYREMLDEMMETGLTHASVMFRPEQDAEAELLPYLREKNYKIALETSAGAYGWGGPIEMQSAPWDEETDRLGFNGSESNCEDTLWMHGNYNPAYEGIRWKNTLNNTRNVTLRAKPDAILLVNEIYSSVDGIQHVLSNCSGEEVFEERYGSEEKYDDLRSQRGKDLVYEVKKTSENSTILLSTSGYERGSYRWINKPDGSMRIIYKRHFPDSVGSDFKNPYIYSMPDLRIFEKNAENNYLENSIPWISFNFKERYSKLIDNEFYKSSSKDWSVWFDPSVSREMGRILRKGGAQGFIVFINGINLYESGQFGNFGEEGMEYWKNHTEEAIKGFNEGMHYEEKNKIKNPDFEAFRTIVNNTGEDIHYKEFDPIWWDWEDTNYQRDIAGSNVYSNLVEDKVSGMYGWEHKRFGEIGKRTIYSKNMNIDAGKYLFSIYSKSDVYQGEIKYYIKGESESLIGKQMFNENWDNFENEFGLDTGEYKLKIVIDDLSGKNSNFYFDNVTLVKIGRLTKPEKSGEGEGEGEGIISNTINCTENWSCSSWEPEICPESGFQTRTCEDLNNCSTELEKPSLKKSCDYLLPDKEKEKNNFKIYLIILLFIVVLIFGAIIIFILYRKRKMKNLINLIKN